MRLKVMAAATVAVGMVAAGLGLSRDELTASAADPIPSWQYPSSIGSGYHVGNGATLQAKVSTSGQWFVFESQATDLVPDAPRQGLYLRDRWTDRTTLIRPTSAGDAVVDLTMSSNGNFVTGLDARHTDPAATDVTWLFSRRTGITTYLPRAADGRRLFVQAINDDGYFIASPIGGQFQLAGRVNDDGTTTPMSETARSDRLFSDFTPSLQYGLIVNDPREPGVVSRVNMVDGTTVSNTNAVSTYGGIAAPAAISPNGRYVAVLQRDDANAPYQWRRWDVQTDEVLKVPVGNTFWLPSLTGVLDDGTVLGNSGRSDVIVDLRRPALPYTLFSEVENDAVRLTTDHASAAHGLIATDINRAVVCTRFPQTPVDTNIAAVDCYLKPFPPSPLAN